jgi:hypothetical protein
LAAALFLFAAWPVLLMAQSPERVYRLGHLAPTAISERLTREFSLPELAKLGFVESQNIEFRTTRLPSRPCAQLGPKRL